MALSLVAKGRAEGRPRPRDFTRPSRKMDELHRALLAQETADLD